MQGFTYNQTKESREMNKISLDIFAFDKHNILDYPVDKLIKDLKSEIEKLYDEHNKWIDLSEKNPKEYEDLDEIAQQTGHSLSIQMHQYIKEAIYLNDELLALYEMKIIYAFKHLEINIKKLISAAYDDKSVNKQFKWENLKQYLALKNIDINKIDGFTEVNQLREVNNSLKHSNELNDTLKKFPEFEKEKNISHHMLEDFYERIKNYPNTFLSSLSSNIYEDLYVFDDTKLSDIAKSFALRMEKEIAEKLTEKLINYYK
jgi:hypothetical protein